MEPNRPNHVGRNDPCPCGSGRKYKKCCINKPITAQNTHDSSLELIEPAQSAESFVEAGYFVIAIMDVMGQTELLKQWNYIPNANNSKQWLTLVKKTRGSIEVLRRSTTEYWAAIDRSMQKNAFGASNDIEVLALSHRTQVRFAHFSDTLIIFSRLGSKSGNLSVEESILKTAKSSLDMLVSCAAMMLQATAGRIAVRGGIEIGVLMPFDNGDPYGPAMAFAHELESKVACWPRVLIGSELTSFINGGLRQFPQLTSAVNGLVCQCDDGYLMVDWLGPTIKMLDEGRSELRKARSAAHLFARTEYDRFATDTKLAPRYQKLVQYIESRPW